MEPDDLLCSRNARPRKALVGRAQWEINQAPSLKRPQASLEGTFISFEARSEGQPDRSLLREGCTEHFSLGLFSFSILRSIRNSAL